MNKHPLLSRAVNLESSTFSFKEVVPSIDKEITFQSKPGTLVRMVDFGTVFIVNPDAPNEDLEWVVQESDGLPLFVVPETWRMPQLIKALGVFDSTSQAAKNGWNLDIPKGYEQHAIRVAKRKGVITTFRI